MSNQNNAIPPELKQHHNKLRLEIVPWEAVLLVARAFDYGAQKYSPMGWRAYTPDEDPNDPESYSAKLFAAALRHMFTWWNGEDKDEESGLSPLAHAAANILMLLDRLSVVGEGPTIQEILTATHCPTETE